MSETTTLNALIQERLSRRAFMVRAGAATSAFAFSASAPTVAMQSAPKAAEPLTFAELPHHYMATHRVAEGYSADVLLRWGDVLTGPDEPEFGAGPKNVEEQQRRFGMNCDHIAYMPLPLGSNSSDHGLLVVNHEYPSSRLMFPGFATQIDAAQKMNERQIAIEMASLGLSVVEIKKQDGRWSYVRDSEYNRRIDATTPFEITGPAAGHRRLQTADDPSGRRAIGTFANCAGGFTPWGTVLSAEENFDGFFYGDLYYLPSEHLEELRNLTEFGIGGRTTEEFGVLTPPTKPMVYGWLRFHERFDPVKHPREPNRFGYVIEIDPFDPKSTPKKRTGLGRMKHECACVVAEDGKPVVVYTPDDARDQFVYRFVSRGIYRAGKREENMDLLADGDLYVAKFEANGTGRWIKIAFVAPWLTPELTGLKDEAELMIETRLAARLLGATPMDRPEDIEVSPITGNIYLTLTSHDKRAPSRADAANPRAPNLSGHILEMLPPGVEGARDHWAAEFRWEILLLAGDPHHLDPQLRGLYHGEVSNDGWFTNPDNLAFDPGGRLWVATDGFNDFVDSTGKPAPRNDGLWAMEVTGPNRALPKHFFGCPKGAEACGPIFTPDGRTLFVAVQHPGDDAGTTYANPSSRWPDFDPNTPPRPSVVAITKDDGGKIGS